MSGFWNQVWRSQPAEARSPAADGEVLSEASPEQSAPEVAQEGAPASEPLLSEAAAEILDTWQRSGLSAGDFAPLVGISKHTLYLWKKRFVEDGPAGLAEQPRGAKSGSKLTEVVRRTIVMLKQAHPDWGCQRISQELLRGQSTIQGVTTNDASVVGTSPDREAQPPLEAQLQTEEALSSAHKSTDSGQN